MKTRTVYLDKEHNFASFEAAEVMFETDEDDDGNIVAERWFTAAPEPPSVDQMKVIWPFLGAQRRKQTIGTLVGGVLLVAATVAAVLNAPLVLVGGLAGAGIGALIGAARSTP
jgi:hypothetical protein